MRIATWSVNSIRQRLGHVMDWLNANEPDVLALQELKTEADKFPWGDIEAAGYRCLVEGQKTYNGVALLSREEGTDVQRGIPGYADEQKRVLAATFGGVRI